MNREPVQRFLVMLVCVTASMGLGCDPETAYLGEAEVESRLAPEPEAQTASVADLDAFAWPERLAFEQALAEHDPRYTPRVGATGAVVVEAPAIARAHLTQRGASVTLRAHAVSQETRVTLSSLGRGESCRAVGEATVSVDGAVVSLSRGEVTEWWRALPSGLEHGVTLATRPAGEGELVLDVSVTGALRPQEQSDDTVALVDASGARLATYAHLWVEDAAGRRLPARMRVRDGCVRIEVDDTGARYPLVVDPLVATEEAALSGIRNFGQAVAVSADGTRAVVGRPSALFSGVSGAADVFVRVGTSWLLEAALAAPDTEPNDLFGSAVAISEDGARVLVGARRDSTPAGGSAGSAHVFLRSGSAWTYEAMLAPLVGGNSDEFGSSVSLSADASRAIVGAPSDDTGAGGNVGSATVFLRSGTSWTVEDTLLKPLGTFNDYFGHSVALSADGARAIVGVPFDQDVSGGAAHVFLQTAGSWSHESLLPALDTSAGDLHGHSVALSADGSRALVGAFSDDASAGTNVGSARVFLRSGASWAQEATLVAVGAAAGDELGTSVALSADGSRALVGVRGDDTAAGSNAGSARVFERTGTSWAEDVVLLSSGAAGNQYFGSAVGLSDDGSRAIVGVQNGNTARIYTLFPPAPDGAACGAARECASGFCVDGVCCASACGDGMVDCQACSVAAGGGVDGTCTALSAAVAPTVPCRPAAGACDLAEVCSASATTCPADAHVVAGTECRAAAGACDVAEACSGSSAACPADALALAGTVCGAAVGPCDLPEACSGASPVCPADALAVAGTECRAAAGACDVAEACSGSSAECPADALAVAGAECRAAAGACDVAEACAGSSAACPADALAVAGAECRAAAGECDVAEACSGSSAACPADALAVAGIECRPAAGACDAREDCSGTDPTCPVDGSVADGTGCADGDVCNGAEACAGGSCESAGALDCDDSDVCTADACDGTLGCSHAPIPDCCTDDTGCDDGDPCTDDSCPAPGSACAHAAMSECAPDAGAPGDAGAPDDDAGPGDASGPAIDGSIGRSDAGPTADAGAPAMASGCSCGASGAPGPVGGRGLVVMALVALATITARRRRIRSIQS